MVAFLNVDLGDPTFTLCTRVSTETVMSNGSDVFTVRYPTPPTPVFKHVSSINKLADGILRLGGVKALESLRRRPLGL